MQRKLPLLTPENEPFWTGGKIGKLLIGHCARCDRFFHPPSPLCARCGSTDVSPRPVSGRGRVISYTINHQRWTPDLDVPYVVAIIGLEEEDDLRLVSNIVGCPPEDVFIGMAVRVTFENVEDVWIPLFEKDEA